MVLLWALILGLLFGYLRGGRIENLSQLEVRHLWTVGVALLIQLLIFPLFSREPIISFGTGFFHLSSYFFALIFIVINWRKFHILLMGLGMSLNAFVIGLNGGYMPASVEMLKKVGKLKTASIISESGNYANVVRMGPGTRFNFLGDRLYLPRWFPLSSTFSIGDVIIAIGFIWLVAHYMVLSEDNR